MPAFPSIPLLPCPGCGSPGELRQFRGVRCSNYACGWAYKGYGGGESDAELAAQWNTRAQLAAPDAHGSHGRCFIHPDTHIDEARYLTDDRDVHPRHELVLSHAPNGDWYIMVVPEGDRLGPTVRFCTSGGASTHVPGLTVLVAKMFQLLADARNS